MTGKLSPLKASVRPWTGKKEDLSNGPFPDEQHTVQHGQAHQPCARETDEGLFGRAISALRREWSRIAVK